MLSYLTMAALAIAAPATQAQRVPAADIEQAVRTAMTLRLHAMGSAASVRVAGRIGDQWLPAGALEIQAGEVAGRLPRSRVGVPVSLKVGGQVVRSLMAWVEMQDPRTVLTYAMPYPPHQAGASMRWTPASVDMTCCEGAVATQADQVARLRSSRALRAGQPVMLADFEPVPDVQARQRVAIEVNSGAVRLQAGGVALRDANVGDRVAVRPDHSRETVNSLVVSKHRVVVDE